MEVQNHLNGPTPQKRISETISKEILQMFKSSGGAIRGRLETGPLIPVFLDFPNIYCGTKNRRQGICLDDFASKTPESLEESASRAQIAKFGQYFFCDILKKNPFLRHFRLGLRCALSQ